MRNWNFYFTILFCFTFAVTSFAGSAPTNNDCTGAALLTVGTDCVPETYTFQGASNSNNSCTSSSADVWFKAVVPASGNVTFESNVDSRFIVNIYSSADGTCGTLSPISCFNATGPLFITGLTDGDMIFIQVQLFPFLTPLEFPTLVNVCVADAGDIIPITEFNDCFNAPKIDITPTAPGDFDCYAYNPFPPIVFDGTTNPFDESGCGLLVTVFKTIAPASGELTFTTNGGTFDDVAVTVLLGECSIIPGEGPIKGGPIGGPTIPIPGTILSTIQVDCQDLNNGPSSGQEIVELTGLTPGEIVCFLVYPSPNGSPTINGSSDANNVFNNNIKVSLQEGLPEIFDDPEQLFASQNEISFGDPCSCDDPRNCTDGGIQYFHDTLTIPATLATAPGLTINVSSATNFFVDVPCFGAGLTNATNEAIPEVSAGVYKIEFWRPSGVVPTLAVTVNGGTPIAAPAATFEPVCTTEACAPIPPIPTMSEWGLMIFGLLVLNLGMVLVYRREELFA